MIATVCRPHDVRTSTLCRNVDSQREDALARPSQDSAPLSRGRTLVMPCDFKSSATRALEASLGQLQTRMISRSRGISRPRVVNSSGEIRIAPEIRVGSPANRLQRSTINMSRPAAICCRNSIGVIRATANCLRKRAA